MGELVLTPVVLFLCTLSPRSKRNDFAMPTKRKEISFGAESRLIGGAGSFYGAAGGVTGSAAVSAMLKKELVAELRKRGLPVSGAL